MTLAEKPGCQDIFKPPNIVMSVQLSKYTMFKELHEAWGHLSYDTISRMYGLPVPRDMPPCITCLVSKATQLPIRETQMLSRPSEGPSRVWLIDMKGKIPVPAKLSALQLCVVIAAQMCKYRIPGTLPSPEQVSRPCVYEKI